MINFIKKILGLDKLDYRGTYISGNLGGVEVSNPSLKKYYKGML